MDVNGESEKRGRWDDLPSASIETSEALKAVVGPPAGIYIV